MRAKANVVGVGWFHLSLPVEIGANELMGWRGHLTAIDGFGPMVDQKFRWSKLLSVFIDQ